jgi:hypothetical protein
LFQLLVIYRHSLLHFDFEVLPCTHGDTSASAA